VKRRNNVKPDLVVEQNHQNQNDETNEFHSQNSSAIIID